MSVRTIVDFADPSDPRAGLVLPRDGWAGTGDVVVLAERSSTKAGLVPPQSAAPRTNPLRMARAPEGVRDYRLGGVTFRGTDQGHPYHLLRIGRVDGALLADLRLEGGCGDAPGPPGETFVLAVWRSNDVRTERVTVDGLGRAASGVGHAEATRTVHRDLTITGCTAWGMTVWQSDTITTDGLTLTGNARGLNHERVRGAIRHTNLRIDLPADPGPGGRMHMTLHDDHEDNPDVEVQLAGWSNGNYGPDSPFCLRIARAYDPLGEHPGRPARQVSIPAFHGPDGNRLRVADAGAPARDGFDAVIRRDLAKAKADPRHWVVVHH